LKIKTISFICPKLKPFIPLAFNFMADIAFYYISNHINLSISLGSSHRHLTFSPSEADSRYMLAMQSPQTLLVVIPTPKPITLVGTKFPGPNRLPYVVRHERLFTFSAPWHRVNYRFGKILVNSFCSVNLVNYKL